MEFEICPFCVLPDSMKRNLNWRLIRGIMPVPDQPSERENLITEQSNIDLPFGENRSRSNTVIQSTSCSKLLTVKVNCNKSKTIIIREAVRRKEESLSGEKTELTVR